MSRLYEPLHRSLQDRFDTRRLADNTEARVVLTEIPPEHKAFIESRDMFFLSTIDHQGRPTVSYKGGDPGFVRVLDNKTVAFPCYDGNGMFYAMGNLLGNQHLGMLFINFEKPHRLIFRNRPRYVASLQKNRAIEICATRHRRNGRLRRGSASMISRQYCRRGIAPVWNAKAACSRARSTKNT